MYLNQVGKSNRIGRLPTRTIILLTFLLIATACTRGSDSVPDQPIQTEEALESAQWTPTAQPTPFTLKSDTPTPEPTATFEPTVEATATLRTEPLVIQTELVSTLNTFLEPEPGMYGVVILDQNGEYLYARNADIPFVAASLYKLVLLADIYAKVEAGELSLDTPLPLLSVYFDNDFAAEDGFYMLEDEGGETTVEVALYGAGAYSSNIAAQVLLDQTSTASLRATAEGLGMWNTWFNVLPEDIPGWPDGYLSSTNPESGEAVAFIDEQAEFNILHITTPNDVAHYWYLLLRGQVISPETSESILGILREQVVTDRIPYLLPADYLTANKTGNLYHVVHDSGLIFDQSGAIVVAALSQNEEDDDHGAQVIQRIALAAIGETELPPFTTDHFELPDGTVVTEDSE